MTKLEMPTTEALSSAGLATPLSLAMTSLMSSPGLIYEAHIQTDIPIPTFNEYQKEERKSKYAGAKLKKATEEKLMWDWHVNYTGQLEPGQHFFVFLWRGPMKKDPDNVAFGRKFVFDALQLAGFMANDNFSVVAGHADFFIKQDKEELDIYCLRLVDERKEKLALPA